MATIHQEKDVLVIVRSVGERTSALTRVIMEQQVPIGHVITVSERPFVKTLRSSFKAALESGLPWTVCVDADIIPFLDTVRYLRRVAGAMTPSMFGAQGLVLDKLFGFMRPAGVRIYQTALLEHVLKIRVDSKSKRPETFLVKEMQKKGFGWMEQGILSGVHDFEQYYRDYYRTGFFHAQKHKRYLSLLRRYWECNSKADKDFEFALMGSHDGEKTSDVLGLDVRNFGNIAGSVLDACGISEKGELVPDGEMIEKADQILRGFSVFAEARFLRDSMYEAKSFWRKFGAGVLRSLK